MATMVERTRLNATFIPTLAFFLISRRNGREMMKNLYWSSCKLSVAYVPTIMNFEFSRQIFEKYSCTKFHENPFSCSRVAPIGRTDGQTCGR